MGKELYPPEVVDFCDWLCDLMCGDPEWEEDDDDRTEEDTKISHRPNSD